MGMTASWSVGGKKSLNMAVAELVGTVWRILEEPEDAAMAERREIAVGTAGEQAAQASADAADYYRVVLAGQPMKPSPRQ